MTHFRVSVSNDLNLSLALRLSIASEMVQVFFRPESPAQPENGIVPKIERKKWSTRSLLYSTFASPLLAFARGYMQACRSYKYNITSDLTALLSYAREVKKMAENRRAEHSKGTEWVR